jgi:formamidopyrimidine-DNA glycosylase
MPELPEVETVCWRLREGGHGEPPLVGRRVVAVDVLDPAVVVGGDAGALVGALVGVQVKDVWRRAKWIVVDATGIAGAVRALIHLKMTGDVHVSDAVDVRFSRLRLHLDDGRYVHFTDPRRFGHIEVSAGGGDVAAFATLGPEPLSDAFTARVLRSRLRGRRPLKASLLDQSVVAGVGNIYADESLWLARLHPQTPTDGVDDDDVIRLHKAIRRALRRSIAASKVALAWRYENRSAPSPFDVYGRGGEPCRRCGTPLSSGTVAGRGTVWCGSCQPAPGKV